MRGVRPLQRAHSAFLSGLLFVSAAATGLAPVSDGDIWWHLAAGREMVARGQILFSDPFSVGASGRPWADVHWLFQLFAYAVQLNFGLAGLVWAKCLIIGAGSVLLLRALPAKRGSWTRALFASLLIAGLFAARSLLLVRPVVVTLLFIALFFLVLERFNADGRGRRLLLLPAAQILWANFQGLSALGPALVGAYALGSGLTLLGTRYARWPLAPVVTSGAQARRHFGLQCLSLVGCAAACCLTPFGLAGVTLPAKLLARLVPGGENVFARSVAENVPPYLLEHWSGEFWHLKWCFALLAVAVWSGGRRVQLAHVLLLGGLSTLALMSNRNVLLLYWLGAPIAAFYLAPVIRVVVSRLSRRRGPPIAFAVNVAVVAGLLGLCGTAAARETTLDRPTPFRMPEASSRVLAGLPGGAVFSADHQGGYLIWKLYPYFRPFIDTRLVLRSPEEFAQYLELSEEPERFTALQAREHFSYVVLPVAYPDRYLGLIAALAASSSWKLIFSDGSEVLFARSDLTNRDPLNLGDRAVTEKLTAQIDRNFAVKSDLNAAARLHLASLDLALGQFREAEHVLSGVARPEAEALRARSRFGASDVVGAEAIASRLLRADTKNVASLNLMAVIALGRADRPSAIRYLRRALDVEPFDVEATQLLTSLEKFDEQ
ncbi:MAG: hypothetical protein ABIQ16_27445 [Polyangiaceae bacterium]